MEGQKGQDSWGCRAVTRLKGQTKKISGPLITIKLSKDEGWYSKSGSKWQTIPELMLRYRASAWLINTQAPEISMGLNTVEELNDIKDVTPITEPEEQKKDSLELLTEQIEKSKSPQMDTQEFSEYANETVTDQKTSVPERNFAEEGLFEPEQCNKKSGEISPDQKGTITEKQIKMLFAVTKEIDKTVIAEYLKNTFGVEKFSQLDKGDTTIIKKWAESFKCDDKPLMTPELQEINDTIKYLIENGTDFEQQPAKVYLSVLDEMSIPHKKSHELDEKEINLVLFRLREYKSAVESLLKNN